MGTYTEDISDDFMTPVGDIVTDPVAFGNSWKTEFSCADEPSGGVEHPCDVNPGGKPIAQKICGIIKTDIFKRTTNGKFRIDRIATFFLLNIYIFQNVRPTSRRSTKIAFTIRATVRRM